MAVPLGDGIMSETFTRWLIRILFLIGYGWYFWLALENLLGILALATGTGGTLNLYGWVILITGVVAPVLVYAIATFVTRKKSNGMTFLVFALGLSLLAVLFINMLAISNLGASPA